MRLYARTVPLELHAPLVDHLPDGPDAIAWLQDGGGFVASGTVARLDPGPGDDRIARAAARWAELSAGALVDDEVGAAGCGPVAFGSFTFADDAAASVLVVPELLVAQRDGRAWLTRVSTSGPIDDDALAVPPARPASSAVGDRPRYAGSSVPDVAWLEAVARAVDVIRDGELDKVVLARDHALWSRTPFDARLLCQRLVARFPACFTFLISGLVGATPELLVRRMHSEVSSLALAGSIARGDDTADDDRLGAALLASEKDRWEHQLAADSVASALAPRCDELTVDGPQLLRLDNVQHLATRFAGRLRDADGDSALALAGRLHPTAAVGGAPSAAALAAIRELEGMDRGRYAGPVGWVDRHGDGEWGIALRCAELSGARARLIAGAGIVAASLPEDELEETRLKLRAMLGVLDPAG